MSRFQTDHVASETGPPSRDVTVSPLQTVLDDPLVSVVIPTYYRNDRLAKALSSVRAQERVAVETIVVDGSGEAHARTVVDEGVCYIAQDEDEGPHAAREVGARHASGEYVQFLDDDDLLKPTKLVKQVDLLRSSDDIGVAYCGIENEYGDVNLPNPSVRGDVLELALRFDLPPCNTTTMLVERHLVDAILPFKNIHGADDIGMKIELAKRTRFDFVNEPLIVRGAPDYSLGTSWESITGRRRILEMYDELYREFPESVRRTAIANIFENEGQRHVEENRWSWKAVAAYGKMIYYDPDPTPKQWGQFVFSLFGRSGFELGTRLWRATNR